MDSKQKLDSFRKLRNPAQAIKDLALLKSTNPTLDRLVRYSRNPLRYADEILYDLLDCCSAEKVVSNRYPVKKGAAKTNTKKDTKTKKDAKAKKTKPSNETKEPKSKETTEKTVTEKQPEEVNAAAAKTPSENKGAAEEKKR